MKTKLLFVWAALVLLFTACEEEEKVALPRMYPVNVYAGMPGVYGYADGGSALDHPVSGVTIKIYRTHTDYLLDQNVLREGLTDQYGLFTFETDSLGVLWFGAYQDTLSNRRGVTNTNEYSGVSHNEIILDPSDERNPNNHEVVATLTNTPTRLQLSVSYQGKPIEGAEVQLYFTEQAYRDSLVAQEDFDRLRPTYGYPTNNPNTSDNIPSFINHVDENFLQTTNKEGVVIFDNLEPRSYWFRITKDTLSNEGMIVRTREALPRNDITTQMEVGIQ